MDDAEAEAVLLALGSAFEWRYVRQRYSDCDFGYHLGVSGEAAYFCMRCIRSQDGPPLWKAVRLISPTGGSSMRNQKEKCHVFFRKDAKAKDACERHHATGKWE